MSIDISRINYPLKGRLKSVIRVPRSHSLIKLSETVPWGDLAELAINDLYKGRHRCGPRLRLRHHIGAFLLQSLFSWTDRELAENLEYYAPARFFCGIPDGHGFTHSAYVKFRNRISEETAKQISTHVIRVAARKGFTSKGFMDFDSTVQEANIDYPSDALMMRSLVLKCQKILNYLSEKGSTKARRIKQGFDFKKLQKKFKEYYFTRRSKKGRERKVALFSYFQSKTKWITEAVSRLSGVARRYRIPWNYKKDIEQVVDVAPILLRQIRHFIRYGEVARGKILSLHAKEVKCIGKGKMGKPYEFGRKWFVGRLPGNYALGFTGKEVALEDAYSLEQGLAHFENIFGTSATSLSADQGFWSRPNIKACQKRTSMEMGLAPRGHKNWQVSKDRIDSIKARRAKVEPIIGNLKRRGMGKSKMKSDSGTRLAGYRAIISLNLSRLARDLAEGGLAAPS